MSGDGLRTSTIRTMSGNEEDFGDFPLEYTEESKESLVGAYRALENRRSETDGMLNK